MSKTTYVTSRQIAEQIKARLSHEVTQRDIAKELNISPAYLGDILAGNREVGPKVLAALGYEVLAFYRKTQR